MNNPRPIEAKPFLYAALIFACSSPFVFSEAQETSSRQDIGLLLAWLSAYLTVAIAITPYLFRIQALRALFWWPDAINANNGVRLSNKYPLNPYARRLSLVVLPILIISLFFEKPGPTMNPVIDSFFGGLLLYVTVFLVLMVLAAIKLKLER